MTYSWTAINNPPAAVSFSSASSLSTTATFSTSGVYTLQLTATDSGGLSVTTTVNVNVQLPAWLSPTSVATWNPATQQLVVNGATSIIADPGADEPIVQATGSSALVTLSTPGTPQIHLGGLNLSNGASATVSSLGAARTSTNYRLLVIGTPNSASAPLFSIDPTSTLNLTDNDMAVLYGSGTSPASTITSELQQAYDGRLWDKPGLTSTSAQANPNTYALGWAESSALGWSSFDGQALGSNAVIVKYTLRGDTDLSGNVDLSDYTTIVRNLGTSTGTWLQGAFDYDGNVGLGDYSTTILNLGVSAFRS